VTPSGRAWSRLVTTVVNGDHGDRADGVGPAAAARRPLSAAQDRTTIAALRERHLRQRAERAAAGTRRTETGNMFTTPRLAS